MQKLKPRTKKEKIERVFLGLLIVIVCAQLGAVPGLLGLIFGLSFAGNALFAKTKK